MCCSNYFLGFKMVDEAKPRAGSVKLSGRIGPVTPPSPPPPDSPGLETDCMDLISLDEIPIERIRELRDARIRDGDDPNSGEFERLRMPSSSMFEYGLSTFTVWCVCIRA